MSDLRKAAQDVVDTWKIYGTAESLRGWMDILEAALAQEQEQAEPAQKPVAWALHTGTRQGIKWNREVEHGTPLYAAPQPQRPPLTDEEIDEIFRDLCSTPVGASYRTMARAIERKVRGEA